MRPPVEADAEDVLALILARDVADVGVPDFTLADLRADWAQADLERDARVVDGKGYAIVLDDHAEVLVHPAAEGTGLGTALRRWAEGRAAERGATVVRQFVAGANDRARGLLRAAGYESTQHYFRLRAELAALPAPDDRAAGLRPFRAGDEVAVHALIQDAFADIEGNDAEPFDRWRAARIGKAGWDPALWLVVEDAEGIAGAALGERWPEATGFVTELAVARHARGRGHGRALLLGVFAAFRRAGLTHAELSVHGRNRGALRLYESVGMRPTWEAERWEKRLGG